jgi:hypothetical protein
MNLRAARTVLPRKIVFARKLEMVLTPKEEGERVTKDWSSRRTWVHIERRSLLIRLNGRLVMKPAFENTIPALLENELK